MGHVEQEESKHNGENRIKAFKPAASEPKARAAAPRPHESSNNSLERKIDDGHRIQLVANASAAPEAAVVAPVQKGDQKETDYLPKIKNLPVHEKLCDEEDGGSGKKGESEHLASPESRQPGAKISEEDGESEEKHSEPPPQYRELPLQIMNWATVTSDDTVVQIRNERERRQQRREQLRRSACKTLKDRLCTIL